MASRKSAARSLAARARQPRSSRAVPLMLAIIALVLLATMDDRHVGIVADGRQMVWTAVAITETGQLGQARARDLTAPRPQGDAVSRYGLAMSFAQVPAAYLAPRVVRRFGYGSSQPLFLIAPLIFVLTAGALSASAAAALGAAVPGRVAAVLLATIASPLGSYAAMELSEPLQAAALAGAFAMSLAAIRTPLGMGRRFGVLASAAGASAGIAVLTKSSLLFVAPFALMPLISSGRARRATAAISALAGSLPVLAIWVWLEIARFGRPLASYAGEGFTHPFSDGLWRLLVGPNKGLLVYFPVVVVAFWATIRALRTRESRAATESGAALMVLLALVALAAPWWAWHGVDGWGPRLLVSAIPLLAAIIGREMGGWKSIARRVVLGICIAINLPPLVQHPTPVMTYMIRCRWPAADRAIWSRVPRFARRESDGHLVVSPDQVLMTLPKASQLVVLPWFARAARQDDTETARRLNDPPWAAERTDIRPEPPLSAESARALAGVAEWRFWGKELIAGSANPDHADVYIGGLEDQVIRAQQLRQVGAALTLAQKLATLAPSGRSDAWLLESYRLLGRRADARQYLLSLPDARRTYPTINIVLALFERDAGNPEGARLLMQSVAEEFDDSSLRERMARPPDRWPPDLARFTAAEEEELPLADSVPRP